MTPAPTPFYFDWNFWTTVAAFVAIVLSQLPPVVTWFKSTKLAIEIHNRIVVYHRVGNPNLNVHIILTNPCGKTIRVKAMSVMLERDGKTMEPLNGHSYYQAISDKESVLLTPFNLKPTEEWGHLVTFASAVSREDEKKLRAAEDQLRKNIQDKIRERDRKGDNSKDLVEADAALVTPFMEAFNRFFIWNPGEYVITLNIKAEHAAASLTRKYRFTLFESDTLQLKQPTDNFKFGDGVYYHTNSTGFVGVPIVEV